MNGLYVATFTMACVGFGFYLTVARAITPLEASRLPHLFDVSGVVASLLVLGLFVYGFFIGPWWQPVVVVLIATGIAAGLRHVLRTGGYLPAWSILLSLGASVLTIILVVGRVMS